MVTNHKWRSYLSHCMTPCCYVIMFLHLRTIQSSTSPSPFESWYKSCFFLFFSLLKFFWVKKHFKLIENSGLKSRFLFCLICISVLLDVHANLPETSPFLSAQMALVSTFFQMFIVLGMYNFGMDLN